MRNTARQKILQQYRSVYTVELQQALNNIAHPNSTNEASYSSMEDLIREEEAALGTLNIVTDVASSSGAPERLSKTAQRKKKLLNKRNQRKQRKGSTKSGADQVTMKNDGEGTSEENNANQMKIKDSSSSKISSHRTEEITVADDDADDSTTLQPSQPETIVPDAANNIDNYVDEASAKNIKQLTKLQQLELQPAVQSKTKSSTSDDEIADETTPAPTLTESVYSGPGSRRKHADTVQSEEVRAEYMATYHARPLEMDRRAHASHKIKASMPSEHIFQKPEAAKIGANNGGTDKHGDDQHPFAKLGLHARLVSALCSTKCARGFHLSRPTVIQEQACQSLLLDNRGVKSNLFIQSETGSGKTLAYLLPVLQQMAIDRNSNRIKKVDRDIGGTRCVILCPTRELAAQTLEAAERLCSNSFSWIVPGALVGGEKRKSEKSRLRKGVSILICTCGRLLDHLQKTECLMMALKGKLEWVILDEADRLLDMGLSKQVEEIMQHFRANSPRSGIKRDGVTWRSILVSATVSGDIQQLAQKTLGGDTWVWARATGDAARLSAAQNDKSPRNAMQKINDDSDGQELALPKVGTQNLTISTPRQLAQQYMVVTAKLRLPALVAFLVARVKANERTVVFMATCDGVDFLHALLSSLDPIIDESIEDGEGKGIFKGLSKIYRLHGNIPHNERQGILTDFARKHGNSRASVLFATDVAARGLNLPGVDWILQYDPPSEVADFVHRAGRAARAGQAGNALVFLLPSEVPYVDVLQLRGLKNISALSLSSTLQIAAKECKNLTKEGEKKSGGGYGRSGSREGEAFSAAIQIRAEECVVEDGRRCKAAVAEITEQGKKKSRKIANEAEKIMESSLLHSSRKAFTSYMRAYPTKEKAVRYIFSSRALHLGHIARSFALKDPPKAVKASVRKAENSRDGEDLDEDILKSTGKKRNSNLAFGALKANGKRTKKEAPVPGLKKKRTATGSFVPVLANQGGSRAVGRKVASKKTNYDDDDLKKPKVVNAQARMAATARRLQSGIEYF